MTASLRHGTPVVNHRRAFAILGAFVFFALALSLEPLNQWIQHALASVSAVLESYPILGPVLFIMLAALSAILAFFSSAVIVPGAVHAWGPFATGCMLWIGWWLGGLLTYAAGRGLGVPWLRSLTKAPALEKYLSARPRRLSWGVIVLMQLALPSEVTGYACGILGVRLGTFGSALALAELPYAVGAVVAGDRILDGQVAWLLPLGAAAALSMIIAQRLLSRRHKADAVEAE